MKRNILFIVLFVSLFYSCKNEEDYLPDGLYAKIETNKGNILLELDYKRAPITVANFITLAEGNNSFISTEYKKKRPFYDGAKFYRVIKGFVIQTGDPEGTGFGNAGYLFKDEINDQIFDKEGVLAMANNGPGTNSSQFFITRNPTPWLNGKHTVFGHVINEGMKVVNMIEQGDVLNSVTILRKGEAAKKFNAIKTFDDYFVIESKNQKKQEKIELLNEQKYFEKYGKIIVAKINYFDTLKRKARKTVSGLKYVITQKGSGRKPAVGTKVNVNYTVFSESGYLYDTSLGTVAISFGKYNSLRASQNGYQPITFEVGKRDGIIPGVIEGLDKMSYGDKAVLFIPSHLGYASGGAGDIIPPHTNLIFEIELIDNSTEIQP